MDKALLARQLRALARTVDAVRTRETIALPDVAPLQTEFARILAEDLSPLGSTMENTLRRIRLDLAAKDFAPLDDTARFSVRRVLFGATDPAAHAARQQARARRALADFREELGHAAFALEM